MDHAEAIEFVDAWVHAWNDHDIERILSHFTDDVCFTSPVAQQLIDGSDGVLRGKGELRSYWVEGLRRIPNLHFDVVGVYLGVDTVVINYANQLGRAVNEVLTFRGQLVSEGHATYLDTGPNPGRALPVPPPA